MTFQKCKFIIFTFITGFYKKNSIFANFQIFVQILKVEYKSFPMMGFRGGGVKLAPPPRRFLGFKYPSRDRLKFNFFLIPWAIQLVIIKICTNAQK